MARSLIRPVVQPAARWEYPLLYGIFGAFAFQSGRRLLSVSAMSGAWMDTVPGIDPGPIPGPLPDPPREPYPGPEPDPEPPSPDPDPDFPGGPLPSPVVV